MFLALIAVFLAFLLVGVTFLFFCGKTQNDVLVNFGSYLCATVGLILESRHSESGVLLLRAFVEFP
jgi:hypothetical protein